MKVGALRVCEKQYRQNLSVTLLEFFNSCKMRMCLMQHQHAISNCAQPSNRTHPSIVEGPLSLYINSKLTDMVSRRVI